MSKVTVRRFTLTEVTELTGMDQRFVVSCIEQEWIRPAAEDEFDAEDLARIRLIRELRSGFGANDESIPLILHLLDQLYFLRHRLEKLEREEK